MAGLAKALVLCALFAIGAKATDCPDKVDVVVVVDGSGSITTEDYETLRTNLVYLVDNNFGGLDTKYSFIHFSTFPKSISPFNFPLGPDIVVKHILYHEGQQTFIAESLDMVPDHFTAAQGHRSDALKVVLLYTDGVDSRNSTIVNEAAQRLKDDDILVFTVGIGNADMGNLASFATPGLRFDGTNLLGMNDTTDEMNLAMESLVEKKCEDPCPEGVDIVMIIDVSATVTEKGFEDLRQQYLPALIQSLSGTGLSVDYAFITFSTLIASSIDFQILIDWPFFTPLVAISVLQYEGQQSKAGGAMDLARQFFTNAHGGRPNALKHAILISDYNFTQPQGQELDVDTVVTQMENDGIIVVNIGYGSSVDTNYLNERSAVSDYVFDGQDFNGMLGHFQNLTAMIQAHVASLCGGP